MSRLVVVSNRVGPLEGRGSAGGLAVALVDTLLQTGGVWFGWTGEVSEAGTYGQLHKSDHDNVSLVQIDLSQNDYDEYYIGYANRTLWPVLHYRLDLADFGRRFEEGYRRVNERFASRLRPELTDDDIIWVHDYHFFGMGAQLREMGVKTPIAFFLHIPFPAPEILAALPNADVIVRRMMAYDLIGFQTTRDAANFRRFVVEELEGEELGEDYVRAVGRTIQAKAYPIGIDAESYSQAAFTPEARSNTAQIEKLLSGRSQIIGVDRIDYSKGLPERFRAFERLMEDYPENRGQVSLMQIAPPSRSELDAYAEIRRELEGLSGNINGRFAQLDWTPIRFLTRGLPRTALAGIYRASRIGLVTPLRDGMNLVAKEYIAAQRAEDPGVLVLSRFAGAAERMPEALIVNPHSAEETAAAIQTGLTMPLGERRERWQSMFRRLCEEDANFWVNSILADLKKVVAM
ncbi:alpha,alpha-trehalose-phosphate synthase (UDP-forming) [Flexibacterium corallicola]|uniref:alpha,alpha-trehalose-phosphate synthase (UDP-forming) n=1 Tax=Flexibacterium corallicola TaxID=3037259 RepID=UPI00286F8753|nr:trehalose-6-phosphate synthase [Pseudovibrio sp. M1P-2-3]